LPPWGLVPARSIDLSDSLSFADFSFNDFLLYCLFSFLFFPNAFIGNPFSRYRHSPGSLQGIHFFVFVPQVFSANPF
jgi:hypothetical protein